MKKLAIILLFTSIYLHAAGFWTLTGLEKANIYVKNEISFLKPAKLNLIKQKMNEMLQKEGIETKRQDSPTLMIALEEIADNDTHYVYIKLALGEEVETFRKDKTATFAMTYVVSDFIDVDISELDAEVLESVDFLLSQFSEQFEDDRE
jgi:hypothetical protein